MGKFLARLLGYREIDLPPGLHPARIRAYLDSYFYGRTPDNQLTAAALSSLQETYGLDGGQARNVLGRYLAGTL